MSFAPPNDFIPNPLTTFGLATASEIAMLQPGSGRVIPRLFVPPEPSDTPQTLFKGVLNMHIGGVPAFRFMRKTNVWEILIHVDGSCINPGYADARAACAFVYGPRNDQFAAFRLERRGPYGQPHPQSTNRAELRAAVAALRHLPWPQEKFTSLVIATASQFVVWGATDWVREWTQNEWCTSTGEPVANQDLWALLLGEIERLWDRGLIVSFWCIPHECNTEAIEMARSIAYEPDDFGNQRFHDPE